MKGLVRILEAIIASIIVLTSLTFFFIPQPRPVIDDTLLVVQAQDALAALDASGLLANYVISNNINALNSETRRLLPAATDFTITVSGIPPPKIYVGCACTPPDTNVLYSLIAGKFTYHGREIEILVENISAENIRPETDVVFFSQYQNLNPYRKQLSEFMAKSGGIFMVAGLTVSQVRDGFMNETFGLSFTGGIHGTPVFYNTSNSTEPSYYVSKYYENMSLLVSSEKYDFSNIYQESVAVGRGAIISDGPSNQIFARMKANTYGGGRTVWLSGYTITDEFDINRTRDLLRASLMWVAGDWSMDAVAKTPADVRSVAHYDIANVFDPQTLLPIFEPFEVRLTVWKIFL